MHSGELLGERYRLLAPLGQGGTSVVWRARDEVLEREVAVKLLATRRAVDGAPGDQRAAEAALGERLRLEARAAARLHHPHVVAVYDFGEAPQPDRPPTPYVVLELVNGHPLSEALRSGPLPWLDAVQICAEVATGLAAAHAQDIVHRDVKPNNVMLTSSGAKLVDFGISATIGEADLGPDGQLLGTPAYLAPERLDTGPVRPACDVYGLGLLLYKSLTGDLPWRLDQRSDLPAIIRRQSAPAPLPAVPGLPPGVADLCRRCLAKRPADRPTGAEAAQVLAAAVATAGGVPAVAVGAVSGVPALPALLPAPRVARDLAPTAVEASAIPATLVATTPAAAQTEGRLPPTRRLVALAAAALMLVGGSASSGGGLQDLPTALPGSGTEPDQAAACLVRYDVRHDSGTEFVADLTLTNTGPSPVTAWRLDFVFPADQQVVRSSAEAWRQSQQSVTVEGSGADATLPAGKSVTLDFEASYRDVNPLPTTFHVNGTGCTPVLTADAAAADLDPGGSRSGRKFPAGGRAGGVPADETGDDTRRGAGHGNPEGGPGNGRGSGPGDGHGNGPGNGSGNGPGNGAG